jgi:preprotein translocase subunit SecA
MQDFIKKESKGSIIENLLNDLSIKEIDKHLEKHSKDAINYISKKILLISIDEVWKEHMQYIANIRDGIHLRSYAQKDPLNEFKIEAFDSFTKTIFEFKRHVISMIMRSDIG